MMNQQQETLTPPVTSAPPTTTGRETTSPPSEPLVGFTSHVVVEAKPGQTPNLNAALARAQAVMRPALKAALNPAFRSADKPAGSPYADLSSIVEACRGPLSSNGLAFAQLVTSTPDGVTVTTRLLHSSGEQVEAPCWMPVAQKTPQAYGSAITYARRYSLSALVGVAAEDDDGNAATGVGAKTLPAPSGTAALRQAVAPPAASPQPPSGPSEPPPHTDADLFGDAHEAPAKRNHEDIMMGNFGRGAGKRLSELDDNSVSFYRGACKMALADPAKEKWHAIETLRLVAFDSELRFRGLPVGHLQGAP